MLPDIYQKLWRISDVTQIVPAVPMTATDVFPLFPLPGSPGLAVTDWAPPLCDAISGQRIAPV
jgi:hypothetical protein